MRQAFRASFVVGVLAVASSLACDFQHTTGATGTAPSAVTPAATNTSGTTTPFSMLGTWTSAATTSSAGTASFRPADIPVVQGCSNFQWTITSQSGSTVAGSFSVSCQNAITLSGNATGVISGSNVQVNVSGTASLPTNSSCAYSLSGIGTIIDNNTLSVPYTGTTCLGPIAGTVILSRAAPGSTTPTPPAPPAPPPPPPPPPPTSGDGINMGQAIILNSPTGLANWAMTSTISSVAIDAGGVGVNFTQENGPNRWPDVVPPGFTGPLEYTLGMCLDISSQWYCSAAIEFWNGLSESGGPPSQYAQNWFYDPSRWAPMTYHQPAVGETIGFFVCEGDCRNNTSGSSSPLRERSNVVLLSMPSDAGASYSCNSSGTCN